jgi:hypothetical protein
LLGAFYQILRKIEVFNIVCHEYLVEAEKKNCLKFLKRELKEHGYVIEKVA